MVSPGKKSRTRNTDQKYICTNKNKWGGATGFPFMRKMEGTLVTFRRFDSDLYKTQSYRTQYVGVRPVSVSGTVPVAAFLQWELKKQARNVSWTEQATQGTLASKDVIKLTETLSHNRDQKCRSELCVKCSIQGKLFLAASRSAASRSSVSILHMGMYRNLCISTAIANSTYVGMLFRLLSKYRLRPDVSPIFTGQLKIQDLNTIL